MISLTLIAITSYLVAALFISLRLFGLLTRWPRMPGLWFGIIGVLAHAGVLYGGMLTTSGLNLSFFTAISLTFWIISALLVISSFTKPIENLGILILPLAALSLGLNIYSPQEQRLFTQDVNWALRLHVISSMLAYALLTLASAQALLLAVQDHQLRRHHPGGFMRALPPLQTMETLLFDMIKLGFIMLSLALISGFIHLEDMFAQHVVHKTILSMLAWIAFAILLWGRIQFGWRGRTAIRWTLSGFITLMLAYFGSKAILELILHK